MNKHQEPPPRTWRQRREERERSANERRERMLVSGSKRRVDMATLIVMTVTCVGTLLTLWVFGEQLRVMKTEERAHVRESAATVWAVALMDPKSLIVELVHKGRIPARAVSATAKVALADSKSRREVRVLYTRSHRWDSIDSSPNEAEDKFLLHEPIQVGTVPESLEEFERTRRTLLITISITYDNGFTTETKSQCMEWVPKYSYRANTRGEVAGPDWENGNGPGLATCDLFDAAILDAELHLSRADFPLAPNLSAR